MARKTCAICNKPSGMYPLCNDHFKLRDAGYVAKCEKCGSWYDITEGCFCSNHYQGEFRIISLNTDSNKYDNLKKGHCILCENCIIGAHYTGEELGISSKWDKQTTKNKYFEIKDNLLQSQDEESIQEGLYLLANLTIHNYEHNHDAYLIDRLKYDFNLLKERIADLEEDEEEEKETNQNKAVYQYDDKSLREIYPAKIRCSDGHYVRSQGELILDNWFFSKRIAHIYEPRVLMQSDPNAKVFCDFQLVDENIFIEYWGMMNKPEYVVRRDAKTKLYQENHLRLLDIEKSDLERLDEILEIKLSNLGVDLKKYKHYASS